ncbi:hypothetical protein [Floccifex sp.]|uniref:hypothetical protein n=1 Tax=Floccifex sp. TaxID=2815810 RepID=UPI0029FF28AD|nr:hypothetical protein [Floccifex sp.]MDD7280791.1 hypothetical protein [Erysipelotrichaceae bacterium]MDY2957666.1 hypothetical protein [Floccifex sp.]
MTSDYFFDTDCLSAFLWINNTNILHELYGGKIILPEPVYQELSNPSIPHIKQRVDVMIDSKDVSVKLINTGTKEYRLYSELIRGKKGQKSIGRGEAGGIALAKTYNGILASNNYKDIAPYIKEYGLKHIDTGQILLEALKKGLITEADGNNIWSKMLAKKRMLPASSFSEYLQKHKING